MAESLLANLCTRIKGSQEDVATLSLQYIVSGSDKIKSAFNKLISVSLGMSIPIEINYSCQSVGDNKERPDMSGVDGEGKELLLFEMKFYAGLTDNQPNGYLDRLIQNGGKALVFVCPEKRKINLWQKVIALCAEKGRIIEEISDYVAIVDGITMTIISWGQIIDELRRVAASDALEAKSDIEQLAGLCSMMDNTAFIPFTADDLGPIIARKEERYYQVIDRLFDMLVANKSIHASGKGLKASPNRGGYSRYMTIDEFKVALIYSRTLWMRNSSEETPFWFYVEDDGWHQTDDLKLFLNSFPNKKKETLNDVITLALIPPLYATLDEIAEDMMKQILECFEMIRMNKKM